VARAAPAKISSNTYCSKFTKCCVIINIEEGSVPLFDELASIANVVLNQSKPSVEFLQTYINSRFVSSPLVDRQLDSDPFQQVRHGQGFYVKFAWTKLWLAAGPACGQRWVTTLVRVKKRRLSSPYWLRSPKAESFQPPWL
jgi:hypothetical protein